jgi:hypothetical protein
MATQMIILGSAEEKLKRYKIRKENVGENIKINALQDK